MPLPSPLARKVCGEAGFAQSAPQGSSRRSRCRAAGAVDPGTPPFGAAAWSSRTPAASGAWGPAEKPAWATAWGDSAGRDRLLRDTPASEQVTPGKATGSQSAASWSLPCPNLGVPKRPLSAPGAWVPPWLLGARRGPPRRGLAGKRVGVTASADPAERPIHSHREAGGGGGGRKCFQTAARPPEGARRVRLESGSPGRGRSAASRDAAWAACVRRSRNERGKHRYSLLLESLCHYRVVDRVFGNPTCKSTIEPWHRNLYFHPPLRRAF